MGGRVLILTAGVGSGHNVAAGVLEDQVRQDPTVELVRRLDLLESTNDLYRDLYDDAYFNLVEAVPWLVEWGYDANDVPFRFRGLSAVWDRLNNTASVRAVKAFRPDLVICTHFMPARLVSLLLSRGELAARLAVVTTDYDFQGLWLTNTFARFFVAREETRAHLLAIGIPGDRVTVSGIPVRPLLGRPVDADEVRRRFDLRPDRPTLLISAGAAGGAYTTAIVEQTMRITTPFQAVVVCGRSATLRDDIVRRTHTQAGRYRVLGYTDRMADLMRVGNLFVGKPGGLSSSECMDAGLPMVLVNPIPGQEERNADYLLEEGAAVRCNYETTVGYKIASLLRDPDRVGRMVAAARRVGRPDAGTAVWSGVRDPEATSLWISRAAQRSILQASEQNTTPAMVEPGRRIRTLWGEDGASTGLLTTQQVHSLLPEPVETGRQLMLSDAMLQGRRRFRVDPDVLHTVRRILQGAPARTLTLQD